MMDIEGAAIVPSRDIFAPRVREACTTDDQGTETAEVKGSWSGGHLRGRSSAKESRAAPKIVTGIPEVVDAGNPEALTTLSIGCLGGRLHAEAVAVIT